MGVFMKKRIEPIDAGMIGCIIMLSIHLFWSAFVFFGVAQVVVDYLFWIHFIKPVYQVEKFDIYIAIYLLITASCIGFIGGYVIAKASNLLSSDSEVMSN